MCLLIYYTSCLSQKALEQYVSIESISFQSWNPCTYVDQNRMIIPRIKGIGGDDTFHELVVQLTIGQPSTERLDKPFQNLTISLKASSEFKSVEALKSPEYCLPKTNGECLFLNQGEAKLNIYVSQLMYEHKLSPTPVMEVPYSYVTDVINIEGGVDVLSDLIEDSPITEGIKCFQTPDIISEFDRFITGERCAPLICPCGAIAELYNSTSLALNYTHNLFVEIQGVLPSCGVFTIENEIPNPQYSGVFEFTYENEGGTETIRHGVRFTSTDPDNTFDVMDITETVQVIIQIQKDPTFYVKPPFSLNGAVVICNWDGRYNWDGPIPNGTFSNQSNVFPIPLRAGHNNSNLVWTKAAWYYIDNYAMFSEFKQHTLGNNGVSMLDLLQGIDSHKPFYDPDKPYMSPCCTDYQNASILEEFLLNNVLPKYTPDNVLNNHWVLLKDKYKDSFTQALTGYRSTFAGIDPIASINGEPFDFILPNKIPDAGKIVVRPFREYRLYGADYLMDYISLVDPQHNVPLGTNNFPKTFAIRRHATESDVFPFHTKLTQLVEEPKPEVVIQATVLISDLGLTGRFLGNHTFIPSTFAFVKVTDDRLKCQVSPINNLLEVNGFICNSGTRTAIETERLSGKLKCTIPTGLIRSNPDYARGFEHHIDSLLPEKIRPLECVHVSYRVRPKDDAPFPVDQVAAFVYSIGSEVTLGGFCDLTLYYKTPLNSNTKGSIKKNGTGFMEISIGQYNGINCTNIDLAPGDPGSDGLGRGSNWNWTKMKIPDQCDSAWAIACFLSGQIQPDEDAGGTLFVFLMITICLVVFIAIMTYATYSFYQMKQAPQQIESKNKDIIY